jgi:fumigallin biosynthesis monooxygenase-like protein
VIFGASELSSPTAAVLRVTACVAVASWAGCVDGGRVTKPNRTTVDLSSYPDLVVIYLGMRVNSLLSGLPTLISFGSKIRKSVEAQPDGLLLHENLMFSLFPPHAGMRQYWRDFDALESWARSLPHLHWWQQFLKDRGGTGFWHETYFRGGQIESVYIDMPPIGLAKFAPVTPARGSLFSARRRLGMREGAEPPPGIPEEELYQR